MSEFRIKQGKYTIPKVGTVTVRSNEPLTPEMAFKIYRQPRKVFPWISLGPDALAFLKKQKLNATDVAKLIANATSKEEVELLASLSDTKTVERSVEKKLEQLETK